MLLARPSAARLLGKATLPQPRASQCGTSLPTRRRPLRCFTRVAIDAVSLAHGEAVSKIIVSLQLVLWAAPADPASGHTHHAVTLPVGLAKSLLERGLPVSRGAVFFPPAATGPAKALAAPGTLASDGRTCPFLCHSSIQEIRCRSAGSAGPADPSAARSCPRVRSSTHTTPETTTSDRARATGRGLVAADRTSACEHLSFAAMHLTTHLCQLLLIRPSGLDIGMRPTYLDTIAHGGYSESAIAYEKIPARGESHGDQDGLAVRSLWARMDSHDRGICSRDLPQMQEPVLEPSAAVCQTGDGAEDETLSHTIRS
jgi:hypothetical protein